MVVPAKIAAYIANNLKNKTTFDSFLQTAIISYQYIMLLKNLNDPNIWRAGSVLVLAKGNELKRSRVCGMPSLNDDAGIV